MVTKYIYKGIDLIVHTTELDTNYTRNENLFAV